MKRILFPTTNRVHLARQKLLLDELKKYFEVIVWENKFEGNLHTLMNYFQTEIHFGNYDLVLIRGDRYEMLPLAMLSAYKGIKIAHIEGGDLSGAIDNKVRHAITALSDIHFATNKESFARLIQMGTDPDLTFNFGSLDVEYAKTIPISERQEYVVMCFHPMPGEDPTLLENIIREEYTGDLRVIKSNKDNGQYGTEEYSPEDYLKLISGATFLIGNSSSFLKEASIYGVPVIDIGSRQQNRLKPHNVVSVPFDKESIKMAILQQRYKDRMPSEIYYKPNTSQRICEKIKEFLA